MTTFKHTFVTLWVVACPTESALQQALEFIYDEEGEATSGFAEAYDLGWYDEDFSEYHYGEKPQQHLLAAARTWRTLDEQALPSLPDEGNWNGIYLIDHSEDRAWWSEKTRAILPYKPVQVGEVIFKLMGTFPVVLKS